MDEAEFIMHVCCSVPPDHLECHCQKTEKDVRAAYCCHWGELILAVMNGIARGDIESADTWGVAKNFAERTCEALIEQARNGG